MEGPTPVSSLIHAATMVTAGIFSVSRCSYLSHNIDSVFLYLIVIGSITSFFSSTIGLFQTDIKRVVAYSTRSQLGYMFICRGSPAYSNSMYHLFNHAFYKALLFLTAGYIIHALSNEQDLRRMGSLLKLLPFPYMMMLIGSLSPVGSPFFSGYYSKDKIVELCFNSFIHVFPASHHHKYLIFSQILSTLAVIFTIAYSLKLLLNIFLYSYGGAVQYFHNLHFPSFFMQIPLLILAFLSMVSGYITSDMMVGIGTNL
jgi:NADH-ubiquinone oxidoreductase chain 5